MPTKAEIEAYLASYKVQEAIQEAITAIVKEGMPPNPLALIGEKLKAASPAGPFSFASGLPDCCAASPGTARPHTATASPPQLLDMCAPPALGRPLQDDCRD